MELICFLIAVWGLGNDPKWIWRGFMVYLLFTWLFEIFGIYFKIIYLKNPLVNLSNAWIYNIALIWECLFISFMFNYIFKHELRFRYVLYICLFILGITYILEILHHSFFNYNNLTNTIMSVLIIIACLYYYYRLLVDENFVNLKKSPEFWWVSGCLFFYFGTTLVNISYFHLGNILVSPKRNLSYYIFNICNILLYGFWSYAIICRKWEINILPKV